VGCGRSRQERRGQVNDYGPAFSLKTNVGAARESDPVDDAALLAVRIGIRDAVGLSRRLHVVVVAERLSFLRKVQNAQTGCTNRLQRQQERDQQSPDAEGISHSEKR
jgi:hypothetical protein